MNTLNQRKEETIGKVCIKMFALSSEMQIPISGLIHTIKNGNGSQGTSMQTVWAEKGRLFIHQLLKDKNNS